MKRFIFLLLLLGCLDAYSQKAAIRVNAVSYTHLTLPTNRMV